MHTHVGALSDLARIKEAFESIRKEEDFARKSVSLCTDERFSNAFLPPTPNKKSWCISVSFPSLKHKSAELPYHSRTQREMGLCSAGSKVHRAQPHLFLQATWAQHTVCQNCAGCCLCRAQRHGEVRCTESPVSSPYRRDLCKMQFLNRHTEIEIVCRLNDILLLFQMLQPGQLIPPGNIAALHLPLFLRAA